MPQSSRPSHLILASSSPYRAALLERLGLPFAVRAPGVKEFAEPGEDPATMAVRLARAKATAVGARFPDAVVIGSDQVAVFRGQVVEKPGTSERAMAQLQMFSGGDVHFVTAVAVYRHGAGLMLDAVESSHVSFRELDPGEVARYVALDQPLDCAGGFKAEAAGVTLMRRLRSDDPTAIVGLPLIALSGLLRQAGFALP